MGDTFQRSGKHHADRVPGRRECLLNQAGFFLVEFIIYLGLLLVLLAIVLPILQTFISPVDSQAHVRLDREAQIFFQQFEREIHSGIAYEINDTQAERERVAEGDQLVVIIEDQAYTYEQHNEVLRRRLSGEGHMVLAQYVHQVRFQSINPQFLSIELRLQKDGQYHTVERQVSLRVEGSSQDKADDDIHESNKKEEEEVRKEDEGKRELGKEDELYGTNADQVGWE